MLRAGQVVATDNLTPHKADRANEVIEEKGCEIAYGPPNSPNFTIIEEASSKLEGLVRKARARTR